MKMTHFKVRKHKTIYLFNILLLQNFIRTLYVNNSQLGVSVPLEVSKKV